MFIHMTDDSHANFPAVSPVCLDAVWEDCGGRSDMMPNQSVGSLISKDEAAVVNGCMHFCAGFFRVYFPFIYLLLYLSLTLPKVGSLKNTGLSRPLIHAGACGTTVISLFFSFSAGKNRYIQHCF